MNKILAWVKKKLGIQSPSTKSFGYNYEYDYLKVKGRKRW
jgi:hypothetical protein